MEKSMESRTKISLEPRRLRFKLLQLKREALFTDITITFRGKSLSVHKCILSASSVFFKLLFTDAKLESLHTFDLSSLIKSEDFTCLESIVNYMYSGEIHLSEKNFAVVASLAEFFGISDLTGFCLNYLSKILKTDNCLEFYLGMRQFDAQLKSTQYPVTVHRGTEIKDTVSQMVDTSFYKYILPQEQTLQVSTDDMLHLLNKGTVKNFCVEIALEFMLRWLKRKQDTDSFKIVSLLVHQACESVVSKSEQNQGVSIAKVAGFIADIEDFLKAVDMSGAVRTGMELELNKLVQEVEKHAGALKEIKQELIEELESELQGVSTNDTEDDVGKEDVDGDIEKDYSNSDTDDYEAMKSDDITENMPEHKGRSRKKTWTKIKADIAGGKDEIKEEMSDDNGPEENKLAEVQKGHGRKRSRKGKVRRVVPVKHNEDHEEDDIGDADMSDLDQDIKKGSRNIMQEHIERNANGKYSCTLCDKEFQRHYSLSLHLNSHSGTKPYRCVECGMLFNRSYHVIRHMRRKHSDKKKFECDVCNEEFTDPKVMVSHWNAHKKETSDNVKDKNNAVKDKNNTSDFAEVKVNSEGKEEYWCTVCKKQFSRHSHLKEHIMIHTGLRPFVCGTCGDQFKTKYELTKHVRGIHLGKTSKFKCENCKRPFISEDAFNRHAATCVGRGYHCDKCGASFHRQYHLDRHLTVHSDDRPFHCPHCPKTFKHDNKLKAHVKTHDECEAAKRAVICELCGTVLKDVKYLKRHLVSHTGVKPHKCPVCLKTYTQAAGLQVHMRIHTGAKPFQCEICSMLFSVKSNLMRHQRRHRGDRRHKCDQCGKGFVMMSDLKRHYTMHTGEKNYACRFCGKKFSSNSKLPQHERIHTGEKPYECRVCGKRFIQSGDRTRHEAIHGVKAPPKTKSVTLCDMENNSPDKTDGKESEAESSSKTLSSGHLAGERRTSNGQGGLLRSEIFCGQGPDRDHFSSNIRSRETQHNPLLNRETLNREPTRTQLLSPDTLNSHSNSSTTSNMEQNSAVATSQVETDVLIRDVYSGSSVYTSQSSSSGTFLASLSDNSFMQY